MKRAHVYRCILIEYRLERLAQNHVVTFAQSKKSFYIFIVSGKLNQVHFPYWKHFSNVFLLSTLSAVASLRITLRGT